MVLHRPFEPARVIVHVVFGPDFHFSGYRVNQALRACHHVRRLNCGVENLCFQKAEQLNLFPQRVECAWLLDVFVGTRIHRRANIIRFRVCRHHD
jgi:hypothetical protein